MMASSGRFDGLDNAAPYPGVRRRTLHAQRMTLSEYTFDPGATFPLLGPRPHGGNAGAAGRRSVPQVPAELAVPG